MKYYTYVLLNHDKKHWYIGSCKNLEERLIKHNKKKVRSTKPYSPWMIVYSESFSSRGEAFRREMFLKSPKGYNTYLGIKCSIIGGVG